MKVVPTPNKWLILAFQLLTKNSICWSLRFSLKFLDFFYLFDFAVLPMKTQGFVLGFLCNSFGFDRCDSWLSRNQGIKKKTRNIKKKCPDQHILIFFGSWKTRIHRLFGVGTTLIFAHLRPTSLFCPLHELPVALQIVKQLLQAVVPRMAWQTSGKCFGVLSRT